MGYDRSNVIVLSSRRVVTDPELMEALRDLQYGTGDVALAAWDRLAQAERTQRCTAQMIGVAAELQAAGSAALPVTDAELLVLGWGGQLCLATSIIYARRNPEYLETVRQQHGMAEAVDTFFSAENEELTCRFLGSITAELQRRGLYGTAMLKQQASVLALRT